MLKMMNLASKSKEGSKNPDASAVRARRDELNKQNTESQMHSVVFQHNKKYDDMSPADLQKHRELLSSKSLDYHDSSPEYAQIKRAPIYKRTARKTSSTTTH
jgi:hypothetical protein